MLSRSSAEVGGTGKYMYTCTYNIAHYIHPYYTCIHKHYTHIHYIYVHSRRLHPELLEDMGRYRKYDSYSTRDLLRVIRNKRSHYTELTEAVKKVIGDLPTGFLHYFEVRFPRLLMHCLRVVCTHYADDKHLSVYGTHIAHLYRTERTSSSPAVVPVVSVDSPAVVGVMSDAAAAAAASLHADAPSFVPSRLAVTAISSLSEAVMLLDNHPIVTTSVVEASVSLDEVKSPVDATPTPLSANYASDTTPTADLTPLPAADVGDVVVWFGSGLAEACQARGWWRDDAHWVSQPGVRAGKQRPSHLTRSAGDAKYRSRLCSHWEVTQECAFRKKGKCDFAHGPLELRVKDTRRDRWGLVRTPAPSSAGTAAAGPAASNKAGHHSESTSEPTCVRVSGGEDVLGAARAGDKVRYIYMRYIYIIYTYYYALYTHLYTL